MARPNEGKSIANRRRVIHKNLDRLLQARKSILTNDGQKFANKVSIADISEEFVNHYWELLDSFAISDTRGFKLKKQMIDAYKKAT